MTKGFPAHVRMGHLMRYTLAPVAPRARAVALPIPLDPPVTRQTGTSAPAGMKTLSSWLMGHPQLLKYFHKPSMCHAEQSHDQKHGLIQFPDSSDTLVVADGAA